MAVVDDGCRGIITYRTHVRDEVGKDDPSRKISVDVRSSPDGPMDIWLVLFDGQMIDSTVFPSPLYFWTLLAKSTESTEEIVAHPWLWANATTPSVPSAATSTAGSLG